MGKIGFIGENEEKLIKVDTEKKDIANAPKKSVAVVYFPERNMKLSYYNDLFDLKCGDIVYVDGKLEGIRGRVVDLNYNFKIKLSEYKRIIALVDMDVWGKFYLAGSHFITFDRKVLPKGKASLWFKAPSEEDEFISGSDGTSFPLDDIAEMNIDSEVAKRGLDYYKESRVRYLTLDNGRGFAIVEGTKPYEVEFKYKNGEISDLTCSCFCGYSCKHEFAAILQLKETLDYIEKNYFADYEESGYFATILRDVFFTFAIGSKETGCLELF